MTNANWPTPRFNNDGHELDRTGTDRIASPRPKDTFEYVTDDTRLEIEVLKASGINVSIVPIDLEGHYQLDAKKQQLVDQAIAYYSEIPNFADKLVEASPAVAGWLEMAKSMSPLALTFFYNTGNMERPSDGLSEQAILHESLPIASGKTATELIHDMKSPEDAKVIIERLERFFEAGSLKDGVDAFGLSAHDIMAGSLDRIGDITRAKAGISMIIEHILSNPQEYKDRAIITASLGSGAAEPVFWLLEELRKNGLEIGEAHLVDADPIAIGASVDRSGHYGLQNNITPHYQNLFRGPVDAYIESHSADVVDLIGIIEYMRPDRAVMLLKKAASIARPGGMIVFGNMLKSRPQQKWFDGLWPELKQRSMNEMLEIIEAAGFSMDQVEIQLSEDGLYAMYAITIAAETQTTTTDVTRELGRVASSDSL